MLLSQRKRSYLLSRTKLACNAHPTQLAAASTLDHDRQSAVVDAVEWAAERWELREWAADPSADPRALHCQRLIAALSYLDRRFALLAPEVVIGIVDRVRPSAASDAPAGKLDAKAAALLLMVEVGAFRR